MESFLKKQSGFTIVEVMIVIGIGALIIVLVLVAAPALQRNARNTQRRNDVNSIKAQLLTVTSNSNNEYPVLTKFNTDVLAQIKPSIYKATTAGNGSTTPAHCSDPAFSTSGTCVPPANWIAATSGAMQTAGAKEQITAYLEALPATITMMTYNYPGPDELHIFVGASCIIPELTNGNTAIGGMNTYAAHGTDLAATSKRHVAFVYQLEGQTKASCEDNA